MHVLLHISVLFLLLNLVDVYFRFLVIFSVDAVLDHLSLYTIYISGEHL